MLQYKDVPPDRKAQLNASKKIIRLRLKESKKLPADLQRS
jgi:hypothetical protein